jgi:hypothetical protein
MKHAIRVVASILLASSLATHAQTTTPATPTADSPELRAALAPFKTMMEGLPAPLRERLLQQARSWIALSPEQQAALRANLMAWDNKAPQDKLRLRERFEAWEQLDAASQAAALAAAEHYALMPLEQRQALRQRFDELSPDQRQRFLFDPANRVAMDLANELFPFIPAAERADSLAMLRALSPSEVKALRAELGRLPLERRDAVRQRLLALDPAARAEFLQKTP